MNESPEDLLLSEVLDISQFNRVLIAPSRDSPLSKTSSMTIIQGEPIVEKKSVFLASFAVIDSMEGVIQFRETLLSDKKIARATHNIMAYRFVCSRSGAMVHDSDDDGEAAAGGRLAEMIR